MRAARFHGPKDIRIEDVSEPILRPGTVALDVAWCGICGTDLHEYLEGPIFIPPTGHPHPLTHEQEPVTMGHELSGTITALGEGVNDLQVGENVVVEPTLRSAIREATASHTANALYTGEREMVAKQILDQITTELNQRGITVENVLLRDIQLPTTLKTAIEAKQQAEQESLAMNFRLQKETQEAQRKRIEAAGVRDFQQIVAQGITPSLLEWKGIEATENLAKSPNSKVVVIGNNKNGLPLILGQ